MNRRAYFLTAMGLMTAFMAATTGCQLVAAVDRDEVELDPADSGIDDSDDAGTDATDDEDAGILDDAGDGDSGDADSGDADSGDAGTCDDDVIACEENADCAALDSACATGICTDGCCEAVFEPEGTVVPDQVDGDCKQLVCDGTGYMTNVDDDTDLPHVDECWIPKCSNGAPDNEAKVLGTPCDGGAKICDGAGNCVDPSCTDGVASGNETDVDCGGDECGPCEDGKACEQNGDCQSGVCGGDGACSAPSCDDGVQNGDESGIDCVALADFDGTGCLLCNGETCSADAECKSNSCDPVESSCVEAD